MCLTKLVGPRSTSSDSQRVATGSRSRPMAVMTPCGHRLAVSFTIGGPVDGAMMAVPVATTPTFSAGTPKALFKGRYFDAGGHDYDVAPDGQRFLMLKNSESISASMLPIILIENWQEELKRLMPTE